MLESTAEGIWGAFHDVKMPGGVVFRSRMTVFALPDGALMLFSPIPIDETLASEIDALGSVSDIVAPNRFHHLFFEQARARYPDAKGWAAPGLPDKRPDLKFDGVLGDDAQWPQTLEQHLVGGIPGLSEIAVFHRATRALFLTDLAFNIHDMPNGATKMMLWVAGAKQEFTSSRLVKAIRKDKVAVARSIEHIMSWDFERIYLGHGEPIEHDAKARLAQAVSRLL